MPPLWEAERIVDEKTALTLIENQFEDLTVETFRLLGNGFDNTAYLVNEEFVFRFPRREIAVALIETESKFLPSLIDRFNLSIPTPIFFGRPTESFPWPFLGYRFISGMTACGVRLNDDERLRAAPLIAEFLRCLHSLEKPEPDILPGDTIGKLDIGKLKEKSDDYFRGLNGSDFSRFEPFIGDLFKQIETRSSSEPSITFPSNSCVVHGDLYVRHLIVDERRTISGVIDWGDVHFGSRAVDLSIAHSFLPPEAHRPFREAYGEISSCDWELARARAAFYAVALANYGNQINDRAIADEAKLIVHYLERAG